MDHFPEFQTNRFECRISSAFWHVNKKIVTTLATELALDLGTCSLHPVHTAFRYGIKELSFDLDEFFNDVHFFFKR